MVRWSERGHERSGAAPWNLCIGKEAENYPPVDEIVLVVRVMADHRRFHRRRSSLVPVRRLREATRFFSTPSLFSRGKRKPGEGEEEAPINFQLYTHHDRNSTLLFPLVTRRCTWRTISFPHRREGGGEGGIHPSSARRGGSPPPSLLYFVMPPCHPSIYRDAGIVA